VSDCLEQAAGSQSVLLLAAHHEIGALMPGVAFQGQGDTADTVYTRLNGSYDPGVAKVMGGHATASGLWAESPRNTQSAAMSLFPPTCCCL